MFAVVLGSGSFAVNLFYVEPSSFGKASAARGQKRFLRLLLQTRGEFKKNLPVSSTSIASSEVWKGKMADVSNGKTGKICGRSLVCLFSWESGFLFGAGSRLDLMGCKTICRCVLRKWLKIKFTSHNFRIFSFVFLREADFRSSLSNIRRSNTLSANKYTNFILSWMLFLLIFFFWH